MAAGLEFYNGAQLMMWQPIRSGTVSLGRNAECDICVPAQGVAPVQLLLHWRHGKLTLENRAADGTWVTGERVEHSLRLAEGDAIGLGPLAAKVRFTANARAARDRTQTLRNAAATQTGRRLVLRLTDCAGTKRVAVGSAAVTLGTDVTNDLVVADPYVSAFHARLWLADEAVQVRDLGSRNGIYAAGVRLTHAEVPVGSTLIIGQSELCIVAPDAEATAEREGADNPEPQFLGTSAAARQVRELIGRLADNTAPVLVSGETGTGKEVVARLLANRSGSQATPFVAVNCGTLGTNLIESELFGHEKGAFTGATARKAGAFEAADGGTLFLDEIGELPVSLQPQLLRVLETGEVRRVGSVKSFHVQVRLVAATNRKLAHEVAQGRFREDLYHRLHVLGIDLPPLRDRKEDIPLLVHRFIQQFRPPGAQLSLREQALSKLVDHDWPGNVRELRNVIQRAVLLREGIAIGPDDIVFPESTLNTRVQTAQATRPKTLATLERDAIVQELMRHGGNKKEAAAALGIARSTIHRKITEYDIDVAALCE